ncbi:MAG: hypothetical protein ACYDCH_01880 [Gaiellaceae bacterium]
MRRTALPIAAVALLAGCGGRAAVPTPAAKPPHLPTALAQRWASEASSVASALAAGDGCTAQRAATALRSEIVAAVNAHQVPLRYQATLVGTANELPARIACNPANVLPLKHHGHHGKHGDGGGD